MSPKQMPLFVALIAALMMTAACGGMEPWEEEAPNETSASQELRGLPPPSCQPAPWGAARYVTSFNPNLDSFEDDPLLNGDGDEPGRFGTVFYQFSEEGLAPFRHDRKVVINKTGAVLLQEAILGTDNKLYVRDYLCPCGIETEQVPADQAGVTQRARCKSN